MSNDNAPLQFTRRAAPRGRPRPLHSHQLGLERLDQLAVRFGELEAEHADALDRLHVLQQELTTAEQKDITNAAAAIASGKRDPGEPLTSKATAAVAEQSRVARNLMNAANLVRGQYLDEFKRVKGDAIDIATTRLGEVRAEFLAALGALDDVRVHYLNSRDLAQWVERGPDSPRPTREPREVKVGENKLTIETALLLISKAIAAPSKIEPGSNVIGFGRDDTTGLDPADVDDDGGEEEDADDEDPPAA